MDDRVYGQPAFVPADDSDIADAAAAVLRGIAPGGRSPGQMDASPAIQIGPADYLQFVKQIPAKSPGAPPPNAPSLPRRYYNPLALRNVRSAPQQDAKGFGIYEKPIDGLTAGSRHLLDYWKKGWSSIEQIVGHRSPSSDNNKTDAMIARVADRLGVDPKQPLDLRDPDVHIPLIKALMDQESSDARSLYGPQDFRDALSDALRARGLQPSSGGREAPDSSAADMSDPARGGAGF